MTQLNVRRGPINTGPLQDMSGQRFGRWTVLHFSERRGKTNAFRLYWLCRCDCGTERTVLSGSLKSGKSTNCGCLKREMNSATMIDMAGRKVGRWTVIRHSRSVGKLHWWLCKCECGIEKEVLAKSLRNGDSNSCGCLKNELIGNRRRTHAMCGTYIYRVWQNMNGRCRDKANDTYGGRGVSVCERWASFENFLADMGQPPTHKHEIDRKDPNGNYEPSNCRWATNKEQNNNKRNNHAITFNGETLNLQQWADKLGISSSLLCTRLKRGMPLDKALSSKKYHRFRQA